MTIEGAKAYLIDLRDNVLPLSHPAFEAVTMAISALEKQEADKCCETCKYERLELDAYPCSDCIRAKDHYESYTEEEA